MSNTSNKRPLSAEEKAMAARMKAIIGSSEEITEQSVGERMGGLSQGQISHWTSGRLPVPAKRALQLSAILGIDDPGEISLAYRELVGKAAAGESLQDDMRPDLTIARLQNDVHALRLVLSTMMTVTVAHRPAEGAALARALKRSVPEKFSRQGLVHELLQTLEQAGAATAKASARPRAKQQA